MNQKQATNRMFNILKRDEEVSKHEALENLHRQFDSQLTERVETLSHKHAQSLDQQLSSQRDELQACAAADFQGS